MSIERYPPPNLSIGDIVATGYSKLEFAEVTTEVRHDIDGDIAVGLSYFKLVDVSNGLIKRAKKPLKTDDKAYYIIERVQVSEEGDLLKIKNYENIKKHYKYYIQH